MIIHPSLIKNEIDNIQKKIKDLENSKKRPPKVRRLL